MKSFNDYLADDLMVFVNPDEMGEKAIVNGKELCVTITHNSNDEKKRLISRGYDIDAQGVYNVMMTLYVRLTDLGYVPVKGDTMIVNKKEYTVIGAGEEKGLVTVRLERNGHDYI